MVQVAPFTMPLSTQEYKWVPANCQGNFTKYSVEVNMCQTPRPFMLSHLTSEDLTFIPHFTGDICAEASVIAL